MMCSLCSVFPCFHQVELTLKCYGKAETDINLAHLRRDDQDVVDMV
jgi:hypothetical protein